MRGSSKMHTLVLTWCYVAMGCITAPAIFGQTVTVQGVQVTATCGLTNTVVLSNCDGSPASYSGITIAGVSGNPAIVTLTDADQDTIVLQNALITATQAGVNGDIAFSATFNAPPTPDPSATPPTQVLFARSASGTMRRGSNAAQYDWFQVDGWINDNNTGDNEINTSQTKTVCCLTPATYGDFSLTTSETWSSGLTGSRVMKAEFWFYQRSVNDKLTVNNVQIQTSTISGPPSMQNMGVYDGYVDELLRPQADPSIPPKRGRK